MKRMPSLALLFLIQTPAFAQTSPSPLDTHIQEQSRYRIRDLKKEILTLPTDSSCLPDYLKRRDQLAHKLKLSPATVVAYEGGGFLAGLGLGRLFIVSGAAVGEWADIVAVMAGVGIGVIAGTGAAVGSVTSNIVKLSHTNRLMKIIHDSRTGGGFYLHQFFEDYKNRWKPGTTEASIGGAIARMDATRELCNGTHARRGFLINEKKLKNQLVRRPKQLAEILGR